MSSYESLLMKLLGELGEQNWKKKPEILDNTIPTLKRVTTDLLMIQNLIIVEVSTSSILRALDFMEKYKLLPRDAIHFAAMNAVGVKNIVTTDIDFCRIDGINVYTCNRKALTKENSEQNEKI